MTGTRRFSQAISEGDGISVIVEVDGPEAARDAQDAGAEGLFVESGLEAQLPAIRGATELPILLFYDGQQPQAMDGADACVVDVRDDEGWLRNVHESLADRFELAFRIADDEHLEFLLEEFDPEIFVLAESKDRAESSPERVLELLSDVPAGKLAIADVGARTREEVEELERAGIDGVIVATRNVAGLVGATPPEV
jgi:NAD(P)H-dependent flavin oxidoreductase YrpB (nitropropane dioxygenase family)